MTTTVTASDLHQFRPVISKITYCLMQGEKGSCDRLAQSREDYESVLLAKAWDSLGKWRSDPARCARGPHEERRYVCKSLWNRARSVEAQRVRKKIGLMQYPTHLPELQDDTFEERSMARQDLCAAMRELSPGDQDIVRRYLVEGYEPVKRRLLRSRARVQKKMRKFLSTTGRRGVMTL
jgi:hypothetical protein